MEDWEQRKAVERMRNEFFYMESYRKRASALDNIGGLLNCETPGTVSEVGVTGKRWRFWSKGSDRTESREIVLTDNERREFADWCKERAAKLRNDATNIENRYAVREA